MVKNWQIKQLKLSLVHPNIGEKLYINLAILTKLTKTSRYMSIIITILLDLGSGFLLFGAIYSQGKDFFSRGLDDPFIVLKLYLILFFPLSLLSTTFNFFVFKKLNNLSASTSNEDILDSPIKSLTKTNLHVFCWGLFIVFSLLAISFPLIIYLPPLFYTTVSVPNSIESLIFTTIVVAFGIYLFRNALIIKKRFVQRS